MSLATTATCQALQQILQLHLPGNLAAEHAQLRAENAQLRAENIRLGDENEELQAENIQLMAENSELEEDKMNLSKLGRQRYFDLRKKKLNLSNACKQR